MSTLKDKFDSFEPQPDPIVWQSLNKALARPRRRLIIGSVSVAAAASAIVLFAALHHSDTTRPVQQIAPSQDIQIAEVSQTQSSNLQNLTPSSDSKVIAPVHDNNTSSVAVRETGEPVETVSAVVNEPVSVISSAKTEGVNSVESTTQKPVQPTQILANPSGSVASVSNTVSRPATEMKTDDNAIKNEVKPVEKMKADEHKAANDELVIWIPNAFAPDDNDASDDRVRSFKVQPNNTSNILSFEMYIYSRSGRLMFHTKDINHAWDGTSNGKAQPMGTYVYVIQLNDATKGLQHTKGTVTLIR